MSGSVEYCTDLYTFKTINRMVSHFTRLLQSVVLSPSKSISTLSMLSDDETEKLLVQFNSNNKAYPINKTLVDLFEEQVLKIPSANALIDGTEIISYAELNNRSNQLANYLIVSGVKPGAPVAICLNRSINLIIGMLGILKAGAAYVPIDSDYPAERIGYILKDTAASIILTNKEHLLKIPQHYDVQIIQLDEHWQKISQESAGNLQTLITANQLAYLIYTSGSTGKPKGVMIEHAGVVNLVNWHIEAYEVTNQSAATAMAGIGFDAFGWEIWPYLSAGASIYLVDNDTRLSTLNLLKFYDLHKISHSFLSTALVAEFVNESRNETLSLKYLLTGGDKLSALDLSGIHYSIVNNYGPTENSVVTTAYKLNANDNYEVPPIGKPIANNFIRILNEKYELVPEGVTGEICIGGAGLARGYWNLPEQTTEKFITDSFNKVPGQKLYKTGDLGKWLPDGNIAYQGRADEQVKIRGFRIELGEIEAALTESNLIEQVIVLAKEDRTNNKQLVAYIVPAGDFDKDLLINYLQKKLPAYMIPSAWVVMESLPLTANGKIDKKALPEPEDIGLSAYEYVAPRNEIENKLAEIWQQLLNKERVGIHDNFFELGGHSLMVMRLVTAIRKSFLVELPIRELFVHPTIALLGQYVDDNNNLQLIPLFEKVTRPAKIPLSFSQERLWFIDQLEGSVQYNAPMVLEFKGNLNIEALNSSLQEIVKRHEVLRTVFREDDGRVYQSIKDGSDWNLTISDGSTFNHNNDELEKYTATLIRNPFNLSKDYMLRATLINLHQQEYLLVVALHHIAADAWSLSILVKELAELYSSFTQNRTAQLPVLDLQYADFSIWQRNYLQGKILDDKLAYWKEKLNNVAPLQLPVDYPYSVTGSNAKGASASFKIDSKMTAALRELSRQQDATLYMTLLTVFKILLYRYSGQEDISVGASIANRPQQEVEGLVGFFVNTLALRDAVKSELSFTELLQKVRTTTLEAYEHQDLPFEKVVEAVVKDRDTNRSPLFQVMMVLLNTPEIAELHLGDVALTRKDFDTQVSRFDLTYFFTENAEGLNCFIEYSTDLFKATTINSMMEHFQQLLHAVLITPGEKIGKLPMITQAEKYKLLESFNTASVIYPTSKSIVDLFEEQVSKAPKATAIVFEGTSLSYETFNEKANQLANHLRSLGVQKEDLVPLYVERGLQTMVGMLGILKAGAAYVPIDTDFPQDRIRYMLKDTNAKIIVCSKDTSDELQAAPGLQILEINDRAISNHPKENLSSKVLPGQLAYVIYTSGSTGKPKGVMITHSNLVDYYYGLDQATQISGCKTFALVSTIATDLGNTVIYGSLLSGGALHLFTKETVSNIEELHRYFKQHPIDCLKIVPGHWKALSQDEGMLLPQKLLVFGGEALPTELAENILHSVNGCVVVNHYGPTETTIGKLLHIVKQGIDYGKTIPIGKPFSNTPVYILSKDLQPCPIGVPGQLFIAGDGVAKGYYNNPELTNEKFILCPFSKTADGKMYGTGDLVKYLPDGNIEFIGRVDDQVKIRGYRVELGEIESLLQQLEAVSQAVVLARDDQQGNKRLVAYIVPTDHFDKEEILVSLKQKLPEYMVPAVLVELHSLPLTANGKVDRKALPDPDAGEMAGGEYVAPRNEVESKLAAIWEDVLEVDQVGIYDDFFELGGHSLLAVRLISAIRKAFKVEMPIGDIFDYPTVALLAGQVIKSSDTNVLPAITATLTRPAQIPLSFSQERLWFIDRMEGSVQYHVPTVLRLKGLLNKDALTSTIQHVVNRHEILRTVFIEEEGQAYQQVNEINNWQLETITSSLYGRDEHQLRNVIRDLINRPFDLSTDHMLRATLIPIGLEEYVLVIVFHHIASDGWSASVLVKEVVELYSAYESGREPSLKLLPIQYADYAIWQRNYLKDEVLNKKLDYWKNKLQGTLALQLPTDHPRPAIHSTRGALKSFHINNEITGQLQAFSQQQGVTLYMVLLSAFKILLHRYSGQQDICVGTPIAGRQQQETESLIGFFVNTLALRTDVKVETPFKELLQQVKATTMEAFAHQELPFEKVVEAVVKERDLARSPLFQVMFIFQNTPEIPELKLGQLNLSVNNYEQTKAPYDISLYITDTADGLPVSIQYCTDLYNEATIDQLFIHFTELLHSIIKQPELQIGRLPMLSKAEEQQLLVEFNNTGAVYPKNKSISNLFEEQVIKTPGSIALIYGNTQLTYQHLNERVNRLAHLLVSKGVQKNSLVPVCIERSMEMVIGILAVLKAGAVYVPIDTDYPEERINYILEDTGAQFLLTNLDYDKKINAPVGVEVITVEDSIYVEFPATNLAISVNDEDTFCIIYTSGSTGKPKGVELTNQAIFNRMYWMWNTYPFTANETTAIKTSVGFVDHIWEMFGPLCAGVPSVIFKKDDLLDLDILFEKLSTHSITRWVLVPSLLRNLLIKLKEDQSSLDVLKYWTCSGEVITADLVEAFYKVFPSSTHKLLNIYGSSEVTADVTCFETNSADYTFKNVPIGKPISNCQVYILDSAGNPVVKGVTGEIYIGGVQVAKGYWNQPELTNEKFVTDHFNKDPDAKLYRTGDLGCWLADGNIAYLGRADNQVKIRGYRIELGEIENVLNQLEMVQQAVVMARNDANGNMRLVGYVVPEGNFHKDKIILQLRKVLPEYMVPVLWVTMEKFPLTSNGKIDKKALPDPDVLDLNVNEYEAPVTDLEIKLAAIWQELLKVERVGINDNFFELGGHSLLGMRVIAAARKALATELSIKDLFQYPTIKLLAANLETKEVVAGLPEITVQSRPEFIPLSFSQERLWFIDRLEGSVQYHLPAVLRLRGNLNKSSLEKALRQLVNRHEVLRTIYLENEGKAYQVIMDKVGWNLSTIKADELKSDKVALQQMVLELIQQPFDLSKDYMLRANLIALNETDYILVINTHHIASDGWSISILVNEVVALFKAFENGAAMPLQPLPVQYADYAIWQRNYLSGDLLETGIAYWKSKLEGVTALELPTDKTRPSIQTNNGETTVFLVNAELTSQLKILSSKEHTTMFMTLLAAFKVLLVRYSGQEDICVGSPIANRSQQEVEPLIGFFVNTLALRSNLQGDSSFTEFLQQVKQTTLDAYLHQQVPFEKVVDAVAKERDMSRSPVFQVMFVLQNTPEVQPIELGEMILSAEEFENTNAKFDITLYLAEKEGALHGAIEYNTDLYQSETINRMIAHFTKLLESIVAAPNEQIDKLRMLSNAEEDELLITFNNTDATYPSQKNIVRLFEEEVAKAPDATALIFEQQKLTYNGLNERANQLAHYLIGKGVTAETLVPISLERGFNMIVGILAILKAGGAYVPIDPQYPPERINYMIKDAGASLIITSDESRAALPANDLVKIISLNGDWAVIGQQPTGNLQLPIDPTQLAYVIYTSGSTGQPKGAMNEHRALVNRLCWAKDYYSVTDADAILQKTTFCFDVSVWELLLPLLSGAKLVFAKPAGQKDNEYLKSVIESNNITMLHFVPSMLDVFLADILPGDCKGLKKVLCSGEALKPSHVRLFEQKLPHVELHNLYGPTEAAIDVTYWSLKDNRAQWENLNRVPIGKPVANTAMYILNENNELVPLGGIGQLNIGGVQVGRGYLNQPALTAEKFIPDPFRKEKNARMYKTGDLGRWLPDGNIEYLGRIDDQVKIRGFRIELGEIENVLQQSGLVSRAIVLVNEDTPGQKRLVAYFVAVGIVDKDEIQSWLKTRVPEYMVPALWVRLEEIPLTSNGKVDKKALPKVDASALLANEYVAPKTKLEQDLAFIWRELLNIETVGIQDSFFELGGDSILTIQVVSRARRMGYDLQPKDIFIHQTIARLSAAIGDKALAISVGEQGILTGQVGLLPIQQWFLYTNQSSHDHFNQSVLLGIDKTITAGMLQEAFQSLATQHDSLRLQFVKQNNNWLQEYGAGMSAVVTENLQDIADDLLADSIATIAATHQRNLHISKGELVKAIWIQTPEKSATNRLLLIIHHLAIDGVSWRILLEDLEMLLTAIKENGEKQLGNKSSSYRQWYNALENYCTTPVLLKQLPYWQSVVNSYVPLPVDKVHDGLVAVKDTRKLQGKLGAGQTRLLLQEVPRVYHTEVNDLLLAALVDTIADWSKAKTVSIGMEGHGREDIVAGIDTTRTTGWFTTLYPISISVKNDGQIDQLIKSVKEQLRTVPEKGLGYGVLKYINKAQELQFKTNPWDIMFNYLGQLDNVVNVSRWFSVVGESTGANVSDEHLVSERLSISAVVQGGELFVNWVYSEVHYEIATIQALSAAFINKLQQLIEHCMLQQKSGAVHTPSDFGLGSDISYQELDKFLDEDDIENIISF
ncbi:MAG: non-ribosomal peptide synthase/polyketide synthase [Ferruginibacter sp.]